MKNHVKIVAVLSIVFLIHSCATFNPQYKDQNATNTLPIDKQVDHTFYLIGDGGNSPMGTKSAAIEAFETDIATASENSTVLFLGDNVYPKGLPDKDQERRPLAEHQLNVQTNAVKRFKGQTIFIPGNHDWYSGIKGLKRQEKYVEDALGKHTFLPENGCPIDKVKISDDVVLLAIDSHWYLTNWDNHPTINDDCDIKTREDFLNELGSQIKKSRGKTTIIAIHHPMFTNGSHGGQYSFASHMKPFPVLGTLKNVIRKTGGIINVDQQNSRYNELKNRMVSLAQQNDKVIFVSGHEHNLQYIVENNLPQIVSGSGSKLSAVRNIGNGQFAFASSGYAKLSVFKDGSSQVQFYSVKSKKPVFQTEVLPPNKNPHSTIYPNSFPSEVMASIYTTAETNTSELGTFLWGERYRKQYGTKVKAPTVSLDTLYGGLTPVRKGGGNQSKSLRLEDKKGTQFVMRALKKQGSQYLQATIFKDQYIGKKLDDSALEKLILDVFSGAHPYTPFAVGDLADAIGVFHTNPVLYYIPKQNSLGSFNTDFGDELYMIEEHTSEGHSDKASFGFQDKLLSTDDMMKKLHKDEDIVIDEKAYIKARLFDMLIGDWDRHQDQWRWIEFKENGKKVYRPMPRDRDQAFSIMSDGFLLAAAVKLIPTARLLRKYSDDLVDVKGVNVEPYPLDMELIQKSDKSVWDAQVMYIQEHITDEIIEKAFLINIPEEIHDDAIETIKKTLRARRSNLQKISDRYYKVVNKFASVKGTNKDDWFDIQRLPDGKTKVSVYRIKGGEKADLYHERTYLRQETKELWIYGLDDDDVFHVYGESNDLIKLRLVGGQNNDIYDIENGKKVTYYDYKSKKNTVVTNKGNKKFTDDYEINVYNYKKLKNSTNQLIPTIGANPDDGFKIGFSNTFTNYGFERNPFTAQHKVTAAYYFATSGYDLNYTGEFANVIGKANLGIDVKFTSPNYAVNFFGYGNSTSNFEANEEGLIDVNLDFNRVKIRAFSISPSLIWKGQYGSNFKIGLDYESYEVERTEGRFINTIIGDNQEVSNSFYGANAQYKYQVQDNKAYPTLGMLFSLHVGYKNNVNKSKGFGYVIPELAFDYKLESTGQLVLATKFAGQVNLGDGFEFYQAANIGANNGLRGYRNERFSGQQAFTQSTDVRFNLRAHEDGFLPFSYGIYGGFDYGRVWVDTDLAIDPSFDPAFNQNQWNTSIGGGVFVNAYNTVTANLSAFTSDDGLRIGFNFGFGF
jgi:hypothetical protein